MILFAALLAQAIPPAAAAPDPEAEVVVVAQRLQRWAGRVSDTIGIRSCRTTKSTGDAAIDKIGCQVSIDCFVPMKSRIVAVTKATKNDAAARKVAMAPIDAELTTCVRARRSVLIADLVATRPRKGGVVTAKSPTRRDEAWRYSDVAAVASVWPIAAPEVIQVPAGETIDRVIVQDAGDDAVAIRDFIVRLGEGATANVHVLNSGGRLGRVTFDVTAAEGSHFELGAALLGGGEQTLEIVTTMNHVAPNATSNQLVRAVLAGRATGSYLGKVAVARHAQKTDATQSVKAMLLDRTATANLKPELEIFADDVKCAHGATVGELDAGALFYLNSRGIAPARAKALLLEAFIASAFAGIGDADERARVEAAASVALAALL